MSKFTKEMSLFSSFPVLLETFGAVIGAVCVSSHEMVGCSLSGIFVEGFEVIFGSSLFGAIIFEGVVATSERGILGWGDPKIASTLGSGMSFLSDPVGSIYSRDSFYLSSSIFLVIFFQESVTIRWWSR